MTNVSTPFANDVPDLRRRPTAEEIALGFPCGAADQTLLNGLIHMIYREMKVLADEAGVSGSDADYNILRDSVQALIAAATGEGESEGFVLMSQAQARLPIHFEIDSADGKINVSSPAAGTVRVPGGVSFVHRGIFQATTTETDFATAANKTYHLRWQKGTGFVLEDLADDADYNPLALADANSEFDGTYDDALIARVVTNASNIATITNLTNRARLSSVQYVTGANAHAEGQNGSAFDFEFPLAWSRTPDRTSVSVYSRSYTTTAPYDEDQVVRAYGDPTGSGLGARPVTRYSSRFSLMMDFTSSLRLEGSFGA